MFIESLINQTSLRLQRNSTKVNPHVIFMGPIMQAIKNVTRTKANLLASYKSPVRCVRGF